MRTDCFVQSCEASERTKTDFGLQVQIQRRFAAPYPSFFRSGSKCGSFGSASHERRNMLNVNKWTSNTGKVVAGLEYQQKGCQPSGSKMNLRSFGPLREEKQEYEKT